MSWKVSQIIDFSNKQTNKQKTNKKQQQQHFTPVK